MPRVAIHVPPRLQARMDMLDLLVKDLAERSGVERTTLGDNLKGNARMTLNNAFAMLKALNYDLKHDHEEQLLLLKEIADQFERRGVKP